MSVELVQARLLGYQCKTPQQQQNALKEIAQEIAIMALSKAGFFDLAAFQGGTCLRILYGLNRFSEDLDFILNEPSKTFSWANYIANMAEEFDAFGYTLEAQDRSKTDKAVKQAFLKANSTGGILVIKDNRSNVPKMRIKMEVDTDPPEGSSMEWKFLEFPMPYSVKCQDLPSLFAGKCHALLCREFVKGRDWYDFIWYVSSKVAINLDFLQNAINQAGPWQGQNQAITYEWMRNALIGKIDSIDWNLAKKDIARFLNERELAGLNVWSKEFFCSLVARL